MSEHERRKPGVFISVNLLISILILIVSAYFTYVVRDVREKIQEQADSVKCLGQELVAANNKIVSHFGWHNGRGDKIKSE
jgi:flagellar biogenesis protein FliO